MANYSMPHEILIDPTKKLFYATPEVTDAMPDVREKFEAINKAQMGQFIATSSEMYGSVKSTESGGAEVHYSVLPGDSNEALVMWAPFADTAPNSNPAQLRLFFNRTDHDNFKDPDTNSWNQITKSAVMSALLKESGLDMPVITIFSPVSDRAFKHINNRDIKRGEFSASEVLARDVLRGAQDYLHGPRSETQIDTLHLHGASLGASHVVGVAPHLNEPGHIDKEFDVRSVTAQELIIGPSNRADLLKRYATDGSGEDAPYIITPPTNQTIAEPQIRQYIDRDSNGLAIQKRIVRAIAQSKDQLKGIASGDNYGYLVRSAAEYMRREDIELCVPLAENSKVSAQTADYIRDLSNIVHIRAVENERATHGVNELVAPTSYLALQNILNARAKA